MGCRETSLEVRLRAEATIRWSTLMDFEVDNHDDRHIGVKKKRMSQVLMLSVNVGWMLPVNE